MERLKASLHRFLSALKKKLYFVIFSVFTREGMAELLGSIRLHFVSLAGIGKRNQGVRQCAHWLTHTPPACADMIRICRQRKKNTAGPSGACDVFLELLGRFELPTSSLPKMDRLK